MKEIWKFYKETNSRRYGKRVYYVSTLGRVKCNGKLYKCAIKRGYYVLCGEYLHRIVAELFIHGWKKDYEIDHINAVKTDNRVENLCICKDHKQNQNNPLTIKHNRESHPGKPVLQYTLDNKLVAEYVSTMEAERQTKIYQSNIKDCCKQRRKSAGGYIWRYKKED